MPLPTIIIVHLLIIPSVVVQLVQAVHHDTASTALIDQPQTVDNDDNQQQKAPIDSDEMTALKNDQPKEVLLPLIWLKLRTKSAKTLRKRVNLYPNIGLFRDQKLLQQKSIHKLVPPIEWKAPIGATIKSRQRHQNGDGTIRSRATTTNDKKSSNSRPRIRNNNRQKQLPDQQQQQGESFQMCVFLRIGCAKINRNNYSQQLRHFVNRMLIQEKVAHGLIVNRKKPSEQ